MITSLKDNLIYNVSVVINNGINMEGKLKEYKKIKEQYIPTIPYSEQLSDKEKILDSYLDRIKKEADILYIGNNPYGIIEWNDIEDIHSQFYKFCWDLPKGGDLHAHDNTMISYDRFIEIIKEYALISLNKDSYGKLYAKYSSDLPENAIYVKEALEKGSISEEELNELLVINDNENSKSYWDKLEQLFMATGDFYNDVSIMEKIWEEGFRSCYEKGIILLQIRDWGINDDLLNIIRVRTIREAYYRVRKDYPDFIVRLIGCSGKYNENTIDSACETLRSIIRVSNIVKDEFDRNNIENFIIGLDLANEEDNSKPLSEYVDFLMSDEVTNSGLKLYLHCGESLRRDNDSVVDAYIVNSYRVGHALNLYRFPTLMKKYAEKKIAIEVCLMSNYRLGYVRDLRLHPALQYLINGIPITLCSDDGLFMARAPMVDDFYAAILCWDLKLGDIKAICRNSITYSGLSEKEIKRLMKAWENKWDSFVAQQIENLK